jgi:hypothetical protein
MVVFKSAAEKNSKDFLELGESVIFSSKNKIHHDIRRAYYQALISQGLLDTRQARMIRSETSEYASEGAIETLLEHIHEYDNSDNLLLLFSDTKHLAVARSLAHGAPKHLLSSLLGTEFQGVKLIIENRMQNEKD